MEIEVYRRADGKWAFRVKAANGEVIGTDGGQGYENMADAERTVKMLTGYGERAVVQSFTIIT
jgi:uncharacterized protein YegP (UPF0339 family)